jgi:capsular exopolysaccharide synthesis family protein
MRFYWTVIRKRKFLILAAAIVVIAGTVAWTYRQPKIYQATATIIIDPQAPEYLGSQNEVMELGAGGLWTNEDYYNTQYRIMYSRQLAEATVRKFGLHHDERIIPGASSSTADEEDLIRSAAGYLQGGVRVLPIKDSRVVGVAFRDRNPELARELANHIAATYIEQNLQLKREATRGASRWVATLLDTAQKSLDTSERELYLFRKSNNLLSVDLDDRRNMIAKDLEVFNVAATSALKQRRDLEARRAALARLVKGDAVDVPSQYVAASEGIQLARSNYHDERRKLGVLEQRYGPKHPDVAYQQKQVEEAKAALYAEAKTLLRALDEEIKALADAEAKHNGEIKRLTAEAFALEEHARQYNPLARNAKNASEVYAILLKRLNESGLEAEDLANNARPLDAALTPGAPVEPNMRNSAVLGTALGFILGLMLAFFVEFVDRSVKSQHDVENVIGLPFLGFIPSVGGEQLAVAGPRDLYVMRHPNSTAAECCRVVRTNILFSSPDKPIRSLVITSSNPLEGKTMTVVNMGVVMAQSGHRTLIVDTDMRRPRLHKAIGVPNDNGVSRMILGETDLEQAVKSTDVPNLFVLPCGPIPPNPAELLQTEKFVTVARGLLEKFDRVIFDSPPVMAVTDAAVLSRVADGTVIVVRAGRTPRDSVIRAKQLVRAVNQKIIGVVLNDVNLKNPHYASYYQYYQYKYHDNPATLAAVAAQKQSEKT